MTGPRRLHPAENRALRELYVGARQIADHWSALSPRLAGTPAADALEEGTELARRLLDELASVTRRYDLYGGPAAHGVGATLARSRAHAANRFLERNQALRLAVLDVQHVVTLLSYLGAIAQGRGDDELFDFHRRWQEELAAVERLVRAQAVEAGADPDGAIAPVDGSRIGRAAHGAANAVGTVGEWVDRRVGRRR
jgi:hypothetical protein